MDPALIASIVAEVMARVPPSISPSLNLGSSAVSGSSGSSSEGAFVPNQSSGSSEAVPVPSPRSAGRGVGNGMSSATPFPLRAEVGPRFRGGLHSESQSPSTPGEDDGIERSRSLLNSSYSDFTLDELIEIVVQEGLGPDGVLDVACSASAKKEIESDLPKLVKVRLVDPTIWAEISKSPKDKALVLERVNQLKTIVPFVNAILGMINAIGDRSALYEASRSALAYAAVSVSLANKELANVTCDAFGVPRENVSDVPYFKKDSILRAIKKRRSAEIIADALKVSKPKFKAKSKTYSKKADESLSLASSQSSSSSSRGGDPGRDGEARGRTGKKKSSKK